MNKIKIGMLSLCLSASIVSAQTIEWTSGQLGGSWFTMSAGIAKIIETANNDLRIKVVPGGGVTNPSKINKGRSQIGISVGPLAYLAGKGKDVYNNKPHTNISMIGMSLSDTKFHVIRAADSKYKNIGELLTKGENQKIGITKVGSSDEKIFSWIMKYYGTSYSKLKERGFKITFANVNELSSQYKDGMTDYVVLNTGAPNGGVIDMLISRDGEVSQLPAKLLTHLKATYSMTDTTIPKGLYKGQNSTSLTANSAAILLVSNTLSTQTVYKITKSICEKQSTLSDIHASMKVFDCKIAVKSRPVPVHAGALKYYKEMGYIN